MFCRYIIGLYFDIPVINYHVVWYIYLNFVWYFKFMRLILCFKILDVDKALSFANLFTYANTCINIYVYYYHEFVDRYRISVYRWRLICSNCCNHSPVLFSSNVTYRIRLITRFIILTWATRRGPHMEQDLLTIP